MIKMKKIWLRGGVSLALVAALSMVVPAEIVNAANPSTTSGSKVVTSAPVFNNDNGTSTDGSDFTQTISDSDLTLDIGVDDRSSYTLSLPKTINLYNINGVTAGTDVTYTSGNIPYISVTDADIPKSVEMTISVPASVTLENKIGTLANDKVLKPTLVDKSSGDQTSGVSTDKLTWTVNKYANEFRITGSDAYKAQLNFAPETQIYAGKWAGTMKVTVDLTAK